MFTRPPFQVWLDKLQQDGSHIDMPIISSAQDAWILANGERVLNLCSNNYLGLANNGRLKTAAARAIADRGVGSGTSRGISGHQTLHQELEGKLARFKEAEDAVLFQSGFAANLGIIPVLAGEGTEIFSDELNHASIIDGCRLSKARTVRFKHADPESLRQALAASTADSALVVTDGVFSMDGDIAPLDKIHEVCKEFGAMLMVDDAHGEGVIGEHGRGAVNHFGLQGEVEVEVGTLSKAFGVVGGYATGSKDVIEFLKQRARPILFSCALTPADIAACSEGVAILEESDSLVKRLWENTRYFQQALSEMGFDTMGSATPITPVLIGDEKKAGDFSRSLLSKSVFVQAFRYPIVPKGRARVRAMLSAVHDRADLDFALDRFRDAGKETGLI